MEDNKLAEFKDDFAMLIEAGFVAVKQLDEVSANRIFQAAQMISPTSTAPQIGLGYIALNKLELKEATRIYEEVTGNEPDNLLAQMFLGICYVLSKPKRKKGEKLIKETLEKATDPTIRSLGELALEWVDKDLKKSKAPFFLAQANEPEE